MGPLSRQRRAILQAPLEPSKVENARQDIQSQLDPGMSVTGQEGWYFLPPPCLDASVRCGLAFAARFATAAVVWNQPYLETCCRAALHRLHLCGQEGRPRGLMDERCQRRLAELGLCHLDADGRCMISQAGQQRHATEVLKTSLEPAFVESRC